MAISTSLDIAVKALLTQQLAVDATAHNISNATTPGYSRQRVKLAAIPSPVTRDGVGGPGSGVESLGVDRVRDIFVDFQIRTANQSQGFQSARANSLAQAELALAEPSNAGLRAALSNYWNAWRDLSNEPESSATRTAVVQTGSTLAVTANRIYDSFNTLRGNADGKLVAAVDEINTITSEIATLNDQILLQQARGDSAADLRDKRDAALDSLSTYMNIYYREQDSGVVDVQVGGHSLVSGNRSFAIYTDPNVLNNNFVDLKFVNDDTAVNVNNGEVAGLIHQRDIDLVQRIGELNTLVGQVLADVNAANAAGYGLDGVTGRAFFTGVDASDIAVDAAVLANTDLVAAATIGDPLDPTVTPPGDGSNAAMMSDLQYSTALGGGVATYDQYYAGLVSDLGTSTREAESLLQSQELVIRQLEGVKQGTSGVNLDEEMVLLMQHQRAYEAAARLIKVIDEMLETLILGTI